MVQTLFFLLWRLVDALSEDWDRIAQMLREFHCTPMMVMKHFLLSKSGLVDIAPSQS